MDWLSPISGFFDFALPILDRVPALRAILGFILIFWLPGFAWTLIFFRQINVIERLTFSLALSIVAVTLSLLIVDRLGIRLTGLNSVLVIIIVTIIPALAYYLNKRIRSWRDDVT